MNRNEFINEMKELMPLMSAEEIGKAISALAGCREAVYKEKSRRYGDMARLMTTAGAGLWEAELKYESDTAGPGVIRAAGASFLTQKDFNRYKDLIPESFLAHWWLYERLSVIPGKHICYYKHGASVAVRPVLIITGIDGTLRPGDVFRAGGEELTLLSESLAIRTKCFNGSCEYDGRDYLSSSLKLFADGWFLNMVWENEKKAAADETDMVH